MRLTGLADADAQALLASVLPPWTDQKAAYPLSTARESPGSGDDLSPAWWQAWIRRERSHGHRGRAPRYQGDTVTSPASGASNVADLPDYALVPGSALSL